MNFYKEAGKFFGYPECCSDWFMKRLEGEVPFELTPMQRQVENGHGFIPCPSCAQKIADGEITHEGLIENRICNAPYPYEDSRQFVSYMDEKETSN